MSKNFLGDSKIIVTTEDSDKWSHICIRKYQRTSSLKAFFLLNKKFGKSHIDRNRSRVKVDIMYGRFIWVISVYILIFLEKILM